MKSFDFCVFIGRFQPFHLAHYELLKESLSRAETTVVVLGSYNKAPDTKNPWTAPQREAMIRASLADEENARVKFVYMRDHLYNDNLWLTELQQLIYEATDGSENVALIGHDHDRSSYYLNLFPQWEKIWMKNIDKHPHATEIRNLYFTHDAAFKDHVHPQTVQYLEEFKMTNSFKNLKEEFGFLKEYRASWDGAPFPPTFMTVDSIVIKSGHILLVRRRGNPGRGLIALPGGFLNQYEKTLDGALRELKEETGIKVDKKDLELAVKGEKLFDHPERSLRGRTITNAFLINLGAGPLPVVKGSDDADKAWWMSLSEFATRQDEFFEDHFHIINYFVGSPLTR
jgi:bifunctional NMN adenylyltransferase/nudix hydrolase